MLLQQSNRANKVPAVNLLSIGAAQGGVQWRQRPKLCNWLLLLSTRIPQLAGTVISASTLRERRCGSSLGRRRVRPSSSLPSC